jgi:alkanesulfonate monooxygenase SsuD/methylene tetrahydromethanopterin reductase-like flavin-dependent oxidoreductase (luciferase family)
VPPSPPLRIAAALKDAGWHPAARASGGVVGWVHQVREAQRGLLDFVTLEPGPDHPGGAAAIAAEVALLTRRVGIVPALPAADSAPSAVAAELAELGGLAGGRTGWLAHTGAGTGQWAQAAECVATVRSLWEGDAPGDDDRPPRPIVATVAQDALACTYAARVADVVFVSPSDAGQLAALLPGLLERHVFVDLTVALADDAEVARARVARLDAAAGVPLTATSEARVFAGTPAELADVLAEWRAAGATGVRLRPISTTQDLPAITRGLVPILQERGAFRTAYGGGTLRENLGLPAEPGR